MTRPPPSPWNPDLAGEVVARHARRDGALLPILHDMQATFGCVPPQATPFLAQALNLSRAEIHGVISFYHDFRDAPAGRRMVRLCRAEACQSMGGEAVGAAMLARLRIDWGGTTADGEVTVEAVYCLGLCGVAPAALVDGEPVGRLTTERLVAAVPSVEKVLLTATGSEATFHALRVARTATGRRHILKFQGCYHGWHDAVAMNVISPAEKVGAKDPLSQGILPEVLDATIVCPFNDADAVERALEERDVAAIILEPIPHNIGAVLPKPGFLERLRELATRHGTVLVFDEVITGFRHGLGGYQAVAGVTPDLTTLGKAMANGWPVSALGGKAELMELFSTTPGRPAFFAGTFNGHPATTAAALATIEKLEREPVHEHVFRLGERARTGLQALYDRLGVPAVVSGFGSVFVSYFLEGPVVSYDDLLANDVDLFVGYRRELMKDGIFELPLNLKRSHMSYAHTDEDVDRLLEATEAAVGRFLSQRT